MLFSTMGNRIREFAGRHWKEKMEEAAMDIKEGRNLSM